MSSLAPKYPAPQLYLVHSAPSWRPLFVPVGIKKVRTGPTTQSELARLLADELPATVQPPIEPPRRSALARVLERVGLSRFR